MQIDRLYYPTETLGYGKRISIWTIGCPRKCFGCSNPELQISNPEKDIDIDFIIDIVNKYKNDIDGITITGGDPFFQSKELYEFLSEVRPLVSGDILVFTGYKYDEIKDNPEMSPCLKFIDVLIDGEYVDELNDNVGLRGSSNQSIIILNNQFVNRYIDADKQERKSQLVIGDSTIVNIGIPIKSGK